MGKDYKVKKIKRVEINGIIRYAICDENGEVRFLLNDAEVVEVQNQAIDCGFEI